MPRNRTGAVRRIRRSIRESARVVAACGRQAPRLAEICELLVGTLRAGHKLLVAGNGGSAAEAMHMAEELVGRFRSNRAPLPAVALAADGTALTCIGNDFGFESVFSRQVEALGEPGDALVLFSTSGNSPNLRRACAAARRRKLKIVCLLGKDGGRLAGQADGELIVRSTSTARIQEVHQLWMHIILEEIEHEFGLPART